MIQRIILVKAVSSAPPEVLARIVTKTLGEAGDFATISEPASYWFTVIIITSDQKHYLLEIARDSARLTTETGHGYFKLPNP